MQMSGVKVPRLGSYQDVTYRNFMTHETTRSLKREQLTLAIALLSCTDEKSKDAIKSLWKELVDLEFGITTDVKTKERDDLEKRMIAEYELMKSKTVRLVRTGKGLTVTGLEN